MAWHDFGVLEGPGWAANAVGGAWEIHSFARHTRNHRYRKIALSLLDHVLHAGFLTPEGLIRPYRLIPQDRFVLNYKHGDQWLCPGSMAKVGYQLLRFAADLPAGARRRNAAQAAVRCAHWIHTRVQPTASGWYPRRVTATGAHYTAHADNPSQPDPLFDSSADSLFILQLMTALTAQGLADYRTVLGDRLRVFTSRGGIFGSINHDVYDAPRERRLRRRLPRPPRRRPPAQRNRPLRAFAFDACLAGLDQFRMHEDRNGVATRGLLFMAPSWDTAYLWENAEAALAYLEAFEDTADDAFRRRAREILLAIAGHHHGPHGFLTEGVDWNNHVGAVHHFDKAKYGDIRYTEPFLNNQHIVEPTLKLL